MIFIKSVYRTFTFVETERLFQITQKKKKNHTITLKYVSFFLQISYFMFKRPHKNLLKFCHLHILKYSLEIVRGIKFV